MTPYPRAPFRPAVRSVLPFLLFSGLALPALAGSHALPKVDDLNPTPLSRYSPARGYFTRVGDAVFFASSDETHGSELWKTDGTEDGTQLVKDVFPGSEPSAPKHLTAVGGALFFVADDGVHGEELWASDGTEAGTRLMSDIAPGIDSPTPAFLTAVGSELYFTVYEADSAWSLWRSDGTPAGTVRVRSFCEACGPITTRIVDGGGAAYFVANDGAHGLELWKSDGTEAGTAMVVDIRSGSESAFVAGDPPPVLLDGALYFVADDGSGPALWKTEGSAAGTQPLAPALLSGGLGLFDHSVYFSASNAANGVELWATDGTVAGTAKVADICAACGARAPSLFTELGERLLFIANDGSHGDEWWTTDGTAAGTALLADIAPGGSYGAVRTALNDRASFVARIGSALLFPAYDTVHGRELWITNGTTAGTTLLADLNPGVSGSFPNAFMVIGGAVLLEAEDGTSGRELWRSDGTAAGTQMVADSVSASSFPRLVPCRRFFTADEAQHGRELWHGDLENGAAPELVIDLNPGPAGSDPSNGDNCLGSECFIGRDADGSGLWKVDYLTGSTQLVTRGNFVGPVLSGYRGLYALGFGPSGYELWLSDGSTSGTQRLAQLGGWGWTGPLVNAGRRIYFRATNATFGTELWTSDGTATGTKIVTDLNPGPANSLPLAIGTVGSRAYYTATDGRGFRLWMADADTLSAVDVTDANGQPLFANAFLPVDQLLFIAACEGRYGCELYATTPGTRTAHLVRDIARGTASSLASDPHFTFGCYRADAGVWKCVAYFAANDGVHGTELWRSDGTAAGTYMVADINPGPASSTPNKLLAVDNRLYFRAFEEAHGTELWVTNGTAAGTHLFSDVNPGPESSNIDYLNQYGDAYGYGWYLYFSAYTPTTGTELFHLDLAAVEPTLTNQAAPYVTPAHANVRVKVDPHGVETTVHFEWGTTSAYGRSTREQSRRYSDVVFESLGGLECGTLYHFRAVARNEGWEATGPDQTFRTLACATLQFSASSYRVSENAGLVTVAVTRTGGLHAGPTVAFSATAGTATPDTDFTPASVTLTFGVGQTSRTFTLSIANDTLNEPVETVQLLLTSPTGGARLGPRSAAVLTITDNDPAGAIRLASTTYAIKESAGTAALTVVRNGTASGVTVDFTTSDGSARALDGDYLPVSGLLSFGAGETTRTITIPIQNDPLGEGNETLGLALSNPTGGATIGSPGATTVTIVDDDRYVQLATPTLTVTEGAPAILTIKRGNSTAAGDVVSYATTDGTARAGVEYAGAAGTITFAAGQSSRTVVVPTTQNTRDGSNTSFAFTLTAATLDLGAPSATVVTIADNDAGGALELSAASYTAGERSGLATITVRRAGGVASDVTVDWTASGVTATPGDDYTTLNGTITFAAGQLTRSFPITLVNDTLGEGPETLTLALSSPGGGAILGGKTTATVTIVDDDPYVVFSSTSYSIVEDRAALITVKRVNSTAAGVSVGYLTSAGTAAAGADYLSASGTLTFAAGQLTRIFQVSTFGDAESDAPKTVDLQLIGQPGGPDVGLLAHATLTILDDDSGGEIQFAASAVNVAEAARSLVVRVTRRGSALGGTFVDYTVTGGTATSGEDYAPQAGTLSFAAGQLTRTFTIVLLPDTQQEGPETIIVSLGNPRPAPGTTIGTRGTLTITVVDDD